MAAREPIAPVRGVLLYPRDDAKAAHDAAAQSAAFYLARDVKVCVPEDLPISGLPGGVQRGPMGAIGKDLDLAVALGGDGTLLRAARSVADASIPVMGVDHGDLGFLTAFSASELEEALEASVAGDLLWEPRERMRVEVWRAGTCREVQTACNDVYIGHAELPRMLALTTTIGGALMATYKADGLIVTTPMGSTAYNLSAGGPIVMAGTDTFTVTPICPHSLTHRPVVSPASEPIDILYSGPSGQPALLSVDGQWQFGLEVGDEIRLRRADIALRVVPPKSSVFDVLAVKLGWSGPDRSGGGSRGGA